MQTYTWTHLLHLNIAVSASTVNLRQINFQFFEILICLSCATPSTETKFLVLGKLQYLS